MATGYLLSTLALLERISGQPKYPVVRWLASRRSTAGDVWLSVLSIGVATQQLDNLKGTLRSRYLRALSGTTHRMGSYILPVEVRHMKAWADLMNHEKPLLRYRSRASADTVELSDIERMVVATALVDDLALVERTQPYQQYISGLQVETLGE